MRCQTWEPTGVGLHAYVLVYLGGIEKFRLELETEVASP